MTGVHPPSDDRPRMRIGSRISARLQRASLATLVSVTVALLERRMHKAFDRQHGQPP
jgi:hypothetical protein